MLNTNRSCCLGLRQQLLFSYRKCGGCPIHWDYRTTVDPNVCRMSDSSALSDIRRSKCVQSIIVRRENLTNTWNSFISRKKSKTLSIRMLSVFDFFSSFEHFILFFRVHFFIRQHISKHPAAYSNNLCRPATSSSSSPILRRKSSTLP